MHQLVTVGSSPQARGTLVQRAVTDLQQRFIPAGAGNTSDAVLNPPWLPVHPRRRGEHPTQTYWRVGACGSSPQARGTHRLGVRTGCESRFIPAGAGNTRLLDADRTPKPVHPRRRGEHSTPTRTGWSSIGSSPQARGTPQRHCQKHQGHRFIPAGAGNTAFNTSRAPSTAVHPRRRGEHSPTVRIAARPIGSSPQARGTPGCIQRRFARLRFIPAGAGNTCRRKRGTAMATVHPRRRGEHT